MIEKVFKIFVDFDGTITKSDVSEAIFREFGCIEKVNETADQLLNEQISAKESWVKFCEAVTEFSQKKIDDFIDSIEIDNTFHNLIEYCSDNNFDLYVLSDGFDYYIERILKKEGLEFLKYYANKLCINEEKKFIPSFPYYDSGCESSANCKRNHIISHSSDDDYTVFIGDGNSDKYTAQFCDFIFAKNDLLKFCERERITYFPFKNFNDVVSRLQQLNAKKRLKKRHQAELKRREAYMME